MKLYNRISLSLSTILLLICLGAVWWARLYASPMRDGYGPDPLVLLAYLLIWVAGIALVHSSLVAIALLIGGERRAAEAKKSLLGNGILWLLVLATWGLPKLTTAYSGLQYSQLASSRTFNAIEKGSLADFEKYYAQGLAEGSFADFTGTIKFDAQSAARLDIMKSLKSKGVAFAKPGEEDEWIESVRSVVHSEAPSPQARLEALQWLLDEGAPFAYSLRRKSAAFSDPDLYWKAYKDLSDPATQQLLELLIAHGVDINACHDDGTFCPLAFMAGWGKVEAVRYLIAHGAPLDKADPREGTTALAGAIRRGSAATVKVLLDAGASISRGEHNNDIVLACDMLTRSKEDEARQVLQLLRDAQVHITAAEPANDCLSGGAARTAVQ